MSTFNKQAIICTLYEKDQKHNENTGPNQDYCNFFFSYQICEKFALFSVE